MRIARMKVFAVAALLAAASAHRTCAQSGTDWPMYGHDLGSTRFSPLSQINSRQRRESGRRLEVLHAAGRSRPRRRRLREVTPIVVNDVMYLPAGNRVVALEPETGKEIWSYQRPTGLVSARGVAYWSGDGDNAARIFFTSGHKLVGLNAQTGKPDPKFGDGGQILMDVPFAEVPTIYKNIDHRRRKRLRARRNQHSSAGRNVRRHSRR